MDSQVDLCEQVLVAIRRITRAIDLHSRQLVHNYGLTGPQTLVLKYLITSGKISVGILARRVNLSQTTVTGILNRLEKRRLVCRTRSTNDKRRVNVEATDEALLVLRNSPPLLQEQFTQRFNALLDWEQALMLSTLQRVAAMMDAQDLSVSPMLTPGPISASSEAVELMEETKAAPQGSESEIYSDNSG